MQRDLVSVVIPTFNRGCTIARAVDSALSQDYPTLEVVVVDDGSTDDTVERMRSLYGEDPRVVYLRQPNGGVCVARNAGIARARGEFIAMLDSDDAWLPGKLGVQVAVLKKHPELSLVWTDMAAVDVEGEILSPKYLRAFYSTYRFFPRPSDLFACELAAEDGTAYWIGEIAHAMLLGNLIHTSTVVARAERLAAAGLYDQGCQPSEDHDYYFRVCKTGPVAFIDAVTTLYTRGAEDAESGPHRSRILSTKSLMVTRKLLGSESTLAKRLPDGAAERALSDLHAWAGRAHFDEDRIREARLHLWRRVRAVPRDAASWKYLAASFLPGPVIRALRRNP